MAVAHDRTADGVPWELSQEARGVLPRHGLCRAWVAVALTVTGVLAATGLLAPSGSVAAEPRSAESGAAEQSTTRPTPAIQTAPATDAPRPNIVWIVVDDMSPDFSCYGESLIETPALDRLAREGVRFTQAFTTAPVCSPSRSALITGMYQTTIGAHHHRSGRGVLPIQLPSGIVPIPRLLQEAGYWTCIGSGLLAEDADANTCPAGLGLGKTDYNFVWDASMYDGPDWSNRQAGQPFFMQVQLHGGKLRGETIENFAAFAAKAKAVFGTTTDPQCVVLPPHYPRDPVLLADWAGYLDAVRMTDRHLARLIARLEREGLWESTILVFVTDHGISHARGKQFLYDEGTRIPLVIRGPGIPSGIVRDDLVEHLDLAATTLAWAGIARPAGMQSQDLFAADFVPRRQVFGARDRCDETVDELRSLRTEEWLYIRNGYPQRPLLQPSHYKDHKSIVRTLRTLHEQRALDPLTERLLFSETRPPEELYAWRTDRWQHVNRADDPACATVLQQLRRELDDWLRTTRDGGRESEAMYDSDLAVYLGRGHPVIERNIALMKRWAAEGK